MPWHLFKMRLTNLQISNKVKILVLFLALGIGYALLVRYTSFCIPCFFKTITGLRCPGCGITHVFLRLMNFDFYGAFVENRFVFATSPIIVWILILNLSPKKEIRTASFTRGLTLFYACSLIVWGVVRNLLHI